MKEWLAAHPIVVVAIMAPPVLYVVGAIVSGRRWGRQPLVLTLEQGLAVAYVVALVGGAGLIAGQLAMRDAANLGAARRADLRDQLRREAISHREVARIARQTARLERPSETDLLRALRRAGELCRRRPRACARATAGFRAAAMRRPDVSRPTSTATRPGALEPTRRGDRRPDTSHRSPPTRRPAPAPHDTSPGPARQPGRPPPVVGVHTPTTPLPLPKVPLCTGIVDLDCDHP